MVIALTITAIYLVGFFVSLTFFKFFGKQIGFDYDNPSEWYEDWDSNAEAYLAFSAFWFLTMPVLILFGSIKLLIKFTQWYLALGARENKECRHKVDGICPYAHIQCPWPKCEETK